MSFNRVTKEYSFCFLRFNKGWSVVSVQNNCPSSNQSIMLCIRNFKEKKIPNQRLKMVLPQQMYVASIIISGYKSWCSKPFTEPTRSRVQTTRSQPELPLLKLIKCACDLWPFRNWEDAASRTQQQGSNLRQSWGQAVVALGCSLSIYSCFGQSSPESRFYRDPVPSLWKSCSMRKPYCGQFTRY